MRLYRFQLQDGRVKGFAGDSGELALHRAHRLYPDARLLGLAPKCDCWNGWSQPAARRELDLLVCEECQGER